MAVVVPDTSVPVATPLVPPLARRDTPRLPMELESWASEFLSRVFALLSNLDTSEPAERGEGAGSGRGAGSLFPSQLGGAQREFALCMVLFFTRLPKTIQREACRQAVQFIRANTFESNTDNAMVIVMCGEPRSRVG